MQCIYIARMRRMTSTEKELLRSLARSVEKGETSQKDLALAVGIAQSQVSRILSGATSSSSRGLRALCAYAAVQGAVKGEASEKDPLEQQLFQICGGSDERAQAVQLILRGIARLQRLARD